MASLPDILRLRLESFARGQKRLLLGTQLAVLATVALTGAVALFLLDYFLGLPLPARAVAELGVLTALALLGLRVLWHAFRRTPLSRLAVEFETRSGLPFRNTLVTAVELSASRDLERFGYSRELVAACTRAAAEMVARVSPAELLDRTELRRSARRLATVLLVAFAVGLWGHDALGYIAGRYAAALGGSEAAGSVEFRVHPGDLRLAEGSEFTVRLELVGTDRFPQMTIGEGEGARPVALRHDGKSFTATLPGLTESFTYRFSAGPFRSRDYRVTVVKPPAIRRLVLKYAYPPYTRLPAETQESGARDVVAPVGTRVTISGEATASLTSATVVFDGTRRAAARLAGGTAFTYSFEVRTNGTYLLELIGPEGFPNRPATHHVTAVEDRPPLVYILEPGRDLALAVSEVTSFPLKVFASDDYGLQSLELHYTLSQRFDYTFLTSDHVEAIKLPGGEARKTTLVHTWDLTKRVFQPGDVITYFVEAVDRMPGEKSHAGRSRTYTIRIPFIADTYKEAAAEQEEQIATVEDLAHKQKEIDEKLAQAMKDIQRQEGQVDWKTRQQLETLSKKQQELKKRAEEVAGKMSSTMDKLQKNDLIDAGTLEKLKEVQDLFTQVADGRMKQLMEQLRELMRQTKMEPIDVAKAQKNLDKQRYGKELDRVLASLRKLRVQQEMQRTLKAAEELAKKQDTLRQETSKRLSEGKPVTDLAARQQELEDSTTQLLSQMDKLAQDAQKPFPEAATRMKEAAEKARKEGLPANVTEARKNFAANQGQQALEQENQALNKMKALQESLIQTQAGMKSKQVSVNLEKLMSLVRFGLDISKLQEQLSTLAIPDDLMSDSREFSRGLARQQGQVCRGLESFERDFDALISDEAIFKSSFVSAVSDLVDAAREAADSFEATHVHSGKQLAGASLEKINRVVAKLIEMVSQLMNQQQQSGMDGFFDQLEKLIEQQTQINEQAERLKQEPSTNPLLQEMMQRMAAEQALVREALEKLAQKYQEAKEVMGDLQGVADEMKEVEEELKKFGNSDAARQKQKRILYRMLEADKSLHKQGESKKRQARFARDYSPAQVDPVEQQLTEIRQKLFNNLTRESYPVEHRDLVERYLRSIAQ